MKFYQLLQKKSRSFLEDQDPMYRDDYQKGITYMNDLDEPKNDIERSYNQFKCQRFFQLKIYQYLFDFCSLVLIFPTLLWLLCKRGSQNINNINGAVFIENEKNRNLLPTCLQKDFKTILCIGLDMKFILQKEDILLVYKIWQLHPFSFFFVYKSMLKVAFYRSLINQFQPKAIITTTEYSFASSILTMYCECNGIEHINVMHGERGFEIRASFFRFHLFYVWDQYYLDVFLKLRAFPQQFIIAMPPCLTIDVEKWRKSACVCDFKYYLASMTNKELEAIATTMEILATKNFKVQVRPHPLYNEPEIMNKYFKKEWLESPEILIEESLSNTNAAIGVCSTVLLQAYLNKIKVIFDDINFKDQLIKLESADYILSNKGLDNLSMYLNQTKVERKPHV